MQVFELLGKPADGKICPAIDGLLAAAQAVARCGIARYGTLKSWAIQLDQTLAEEGKVDQP